MKKAKNYSSDIRNIIYLTIVPVTYLLYNVYISLLASNSLCIASLLNSETLQSLLDTVFISSIVMIIIFIILYYLTLFLKKNKKVQGLLAILYFIIAICITFSSDRFNCIFFFALAVLAFIQYIYNDEKFKRNRK